LETVAEVVAVDFEFHWGVIRRNFRLLTIPMNKVLIS
jgi:hypothetical protein